MVHGAIYLSLLQIMGEVTGSNCLLIYKHPTYFVNSFSNFFAKTTIIGFGCIIDLRFIWERLNLLMVISLMACIKCVQDNIVVCGCAVIYSLESCAVGFELLILLILSLLIHSKFALKRHFNATIGTAILAAKFTLPSRYFFYPSMDFSAA